MRKVHHAARRPDLAAEGAVVKLITATERRVAIKRTVSRKGHVLSDALHITNVFGAGWLYRAEAQA